jgi:hypothetical protein
VKSEPDDLVGGDDVPRNDDSPDSSVTPGTPVKTEKPAATPVKKEIKAEPVSKEFQIKMEELKRLRGSDQVCCFH